MIEPAWIEAPTSGILHVAGEGFPRRECQDGTRLLCGWVLTAGAANPDKRGWNSERVGKKCRRCLAWLKKGAHA